jgi:hypothetical protein
MCVLLSRKNAGPSSWNASASDTFPHFGHLISISHLSAIMAQLLTRNSTSLPVSGFAIAPVARRWEIGTSGILPPTPHQDVAGADLLLDGSTSA